MSIQVNDRIVWPGGKRKAFTLSFDDGIEQDIRLIEMLNRYGAKCTFNLNPGLFGRSGSVRAGGREVPHVKLRTEQIAEVYAGHELAGHGMYHMRLDGMDGARCAKEVLAGREALEQIAGQPVRGFAYSFGSFDENTVSVLKTCGITYARTITATHSFGIPNDFLRWDPTCHYRDPELMPLLSRFIEGDPRHIFYITQLFYVWGHSYEFDQHDDWEIAETMLKTICSRNDVWFATNAEIEEYVRAYKSLVYTVDGKKAYNPTALPVWIGGNFTEESVMILPGKTAELIPAREV